MLRPHSLARRERILARRSVRRQMEARLAEQQATDSWARNTDLLSVRLV